MASILVIDDNDDFRKLMKEVLEKEGYEVLDASDGDEGIRLYRDHGADVVITDMIMPKKEGLETMIDLRKEFPDVKIIAISGDGFEEPMTYLDSAKLIGGAEYAFTKPFAMKELLATIKKLVEDRSKER